MHVLFSTDEDIFNPWFSLNGTALSIDEYVVPPGDLVPILLIGARGSRGTSTAAMLASQMPVQFDNTKQDLESYATTLQSTLYAEVMLRSSLPVRVTVTLAGYGSEDVRKCFVQLHDRALIPA